MIVGIGLDIVDVERVRRLLARRGEHALRRLFTSAEREYAETRQDAALHLAARIAAKEATYKALSGSESARAVGWREIEVVRGWEGPTLRLHGLAERRAGELRVTRTHLSLSHSALTAAAVVVLESADLDPR
jgi:holo-[acyl-carrier protein] synthase